MLSGALSFARKQWSFSLPPPVVQLGGDVPLAHHGVTHDARVLWGQGYARDLRAAVIGSGFAVDRRRLFFRGLFHFRDRQHFRADDSRHSPSVEVQLARDLAA